MTSLTHRKGGKIMAKIVRFYEIGTADVLKVEEAPVQDPGRGEVRIQVKAFALNRSEVYFRQDQYIRDLL